MTRENKSIIEQLIKLSIQQNSTHYLPIIIPMGFNIVSFFIVLITRNLRRRLGQLKLTLSIIAKLMGPMRS